MGRFSNTRISIGTKGNPQTSLEQGTYKKMFINIQLFAVNKQKQARHNENNKTGRSILFGGEKAAEAIVEKYSGRGKWISSHKERVKCDEVIGIYKDKSGKATRSNVAIIVHSLTGDHVYPGNPNGGN